MARTAQVVRGLVIRQREQASIEALPNNSVGLDALRDEIRNGLIPLGAIIPIMSNLSGTSIPASGTVSNGFMRSDGVAVPSGHTVSGTTPNLTSGRFVYGTSGSGVGANVAAGATGGNAGNVRTLTPSELPSHNHPLTIATDNAPHAHPASTGNQSANHSHPASVNSNNAPHQHQETSVSVGGGGPGVERFAASGTQAQPQNTVGANAPHAHPFSIGSNDANHSHPITVNANNAPHSHAGSSIGPQGSGSSFSILPEYVAAVYLIRVS
jgi:hypothetical protein